MSKNSVAELGKVFPSDALSGGPPGSGRATLSPRPGYSLGIGDDAEATTVACPCRPGLPVNRDRPDIGFIMRWNGQGEETFSVGRRLVMGKLSIPSLYPGDGVATAGLGLVQALIHPFQQGIEILSRLLHTGNSHAHGDGVRSV